MSGTQPSHRAFVVVLVSRSRASLGVALSTCQQLLAVLQRGVSRARSAEEPLVELARAADAQGIPGVSGPLLAT